jgi:predicted nucleotidyltransferase
MGIRYCSVPRPVVAQDAPHDEARGAALSDENTSLVVPAGNTLRARYENAVAELVEKVKADRLVLAVILCGSLAHDEVWEKSDVDLVVVTADDLKESRSYTLVEDDINVHAYLTPRGKFKTTVHGSLQGSFLHSLLSKGKVLFARDESLVDLFETLGHLGGRDREVAMLRAASFVFPSLNKAEKWLYAKRDPLYCFFWIMKLVDAVAQLEILYHGEVPGREAVQQAKRHNPALMSAIYDELIEGPKTAAAMEQALALVRQQLLLRREAFAPLLAYLADAGGPRSASEIAHHFSRQLGIESAEMALEWLAEQGLVQKLSAPCRLMEKSRVSVEEAAYTT